MKTACARRILLVLALLATVVFATACGGGGASTAGPADGVVTQGEGSAPTVLPPTDPGDGTSSPEPAPGQGTTVAVAATADFELTLSLSGPTGGLPDAAGVPQYSSGQMITATLELRNVSGQSRTVLMTDVPFQRISAWHEASGHMIWPTELHVADPPYFVTLAPDERRAFARAWLPTMHPLGRYRVRGLVATADARIPGALELVLDVR